MNGLNEVIFELLDSSAKRSRASTSPPPVIARAPARTPTCCIADARKARLARAAAVERLTREAERMSGAARDTVRKVRDVPAPGVETKTSRSLQDAE